MTDAGTSDLDSLLNRMRSATAPIRSTVNNLHHEFQPLRDGTVASYIPELAAADPEMFGISITTVGGQSAEAGDADHLFSIQSISKPFAYGLALDRLGRQAVLDKVNVEPSGDPFNSILLDERTNRPFNPLVNSGAIATCDLIDGPDLTARVKAMLSLFSTYCNRPVFVDNATFISERLTGHRNRAIAHLMLNFGMVRDRVEETLELYFQQCSLMVSCRDLSLMAATLANSGVNPVSGQRAIESAHVKDVLSVMLSCGMYNFSGEWAYTVGLPAKSGVSGGIIAVVPGKYGIAVYSPRLDIRGNSVRGVAVCRALAERYGLHPLDTSGNGLSLGDEFRPSRG